MTYKATSPIFVCVAGMNTSADADDYSRSWLGSSNSGLVQSADTYVVEGIVWTRCIRQSLAAEVGFSWMSKRAAAFMTTWGPLMLPCGKLAKMAL